MRIRVTALSMVMFAMRLGAQGAGTSADVPDSHRPPPGMCRIWIDGVPADRQPAPTDCATAVRRRPANARVIFGEQPAASASAAQPSPPPAAEQPHGDTKAEAVQPKTEVHPPVPPAARTPTVIVPGAPRPSTAHPHPPAGSPAHVSPKPSGHPQFQH
jgi:hypothetical protein